MDPMPGAVQAYRELSQLFDTYIPSTAPWDNPERMVGQVALGQRATSVANPMIRRTSG